MGTLGNGELRCTPVDYLLGDEWLFRIGRSTLFLLIQFPLDFAPVNGEIEFEFTISFAGEIGIDVLVRLEHVVYQLKRFLDYLVFFLCLSFVVVSCELFH